MRNPFRRKPKPKLEPRPCEVLLIEDSAMLYESLGISEQRKTDLINIIKDAINNHNRLDVMLAHVSKRSVHPNELAFMSLILGGIVHSAKQLNDIKRFLGQ